MRRTNDSNVRNPSKKIGYIKDKKKKTFAKDEKYKESMEKLYEFAQTTDEKKVLLEGLDQLRKSFNNKSLLEILKLLMNPFYAALVKNESLYYPLPHVEPYIFEEQFIVLYKKLEPIVDELTYKEENSRYQQIIHPKCNQCKKSMKFHPHKGLTIGYYQCTSCKVSITQDDYNQELFDAVKNLLSSKLQVNHANVLSSKVKGLIKKKRKDLKQTDLNISKLQLKLVEYSNTSLAYDILDKIKQLRQEISEVKEEINVAVLYEKSSHTLMLWNEDFKKLLFSEISEISKILLGDVYIGDNQLYTEFYINDYFNVAYEEGVLEIE